MDPANAGRQTSQKDGLAEVGNRLWHELEQLELERSRPRDRETPVSHDCSAGPRKRLPPPPPPPPP